MVVAQVVGAATRRRALRGGALALVAGTALAVGCGSGNRYQPPPPPEVTVAQPEERDVTIPGEFTGHTVAFETTDIRARVEGFLDSYAFTPGSDVKQGDLLFVIEPTLYRAQVEQAKADLEGKDADFHAAEQQLEITQAIYQKSAGSRADLVQKTQARDLARAEVERAKANLQAAELKLSYTHIFAPFPGIIDRNLVDVGNLVGSGEPTKLATIVRVDPIYAYFTMSERELLQYREMQASLGAETGQDGGEARLALATDSGFPHLGQVDYTSNRVDPDTGTIELRAVFPNPDRQILPGMFARVQLPMSRIHALLVPAAALAADQGGEYLLVVLDGGKVEYRRVTVGPPVGEELRVILSGVTPEDRVIVSGVQRARPGGEVKPVHAGAPATAPAPAAPASAAAPPAK
jgi:RND family efflux transporter MFP subunit